MVTKKEKIKAGIASLGVAIVIFVAVKGKRDFDKACEKARKSMVENVAIMMSANNKKCDTAPNVQLCFQMQVQNFYRMMEDVEQILKDSGCSK